METITIFDNLSDFQEHARKRRADEIYMKRQIQVIPNTPKHLGGFQFTALTQVGAEARLLVCIEQTAEEEITTQEQADKLLQTMNDRETAILEEFRKYNGASQVIKGAISFRG